MVRSRKDLCNISHMGVLQIVLDVLMAGALSAVLV